MEKNLRNIYIFLIALLDIPLNIWGQIISKCSTFWCFVPWYSLCGTKIYKAKYVQLKIYPQERSADLLNWASPSDSWSIFSHHSSEPGLQFCRPRNLISTVYLEVTNSGALTNTKQTDKKIIYQLECHLMSIQQLYLSHNNRQLPFCLI